MNVRQAVPFFRVSNMEEAIRFYVQGLGGQIRDKWEPDGKLRWCWLTLGEAALMLQGVPDRGALFLDAVRKGRRRRLDLLPL